MSNKNPKTKSRRIKQNYGSKSKAKPRDTSLNNQNYESKSTSSDIDKNKSENKELNKAFSVELGSQDYATNALAHNAEQEVTIDEKSNPQLDVKEEEKINQQIELKRLDQNFSQEQKEINKNDVVENTKFQGKLISHATKKPLEELNNLSTSQTPYREDNNKSESSSDTTSYINKNVVEINQDNQINHNKNRIDQNFLIIETSINDLKNNIITFESYLFESRNDNENLKRKLLEAETNFDNLTDQYQRLLGQLEEKQIQIQNSNQTIENCNQEISRLRSQISDEKLIIASDWAKELSGILSDLSGLANQDPDPDQGMSARAVFEAMLDWMTKVFKERPKQFPVKQELSCDENNHLWIELDTTRSVVSDLLKLYDWGYESPFANLPKKGKSVKMRIQKYGWKVGDIILVRSKITSLEPDFEAKE